MERTDQDPLLPHFSEFLAQQIGLHFPQERWPDLMRGIDAIAREFRFKDSAACIQHFLSSPLNRNQVEVLARHLTIGETYFFRDPQVFEVLQNHTLPPLIQARRQAGQLLRIWSAGCATGEEAYSLAILLQRMIPDCRQWNITILATDINPQALEKAAAGIYGEWSFRNAPSGLREGYFRTIGKGLYEIIPAIREMVTFSYLNLAEDVYPSLANNTNAMDIILCRNVLMYFEPGLAASVVRKYHQSLVGGGWLVVSPSEISQASFARFIPANFPGAILHQKTAIDQKTETKTRRQRAPTFAPETKKSVSPPPAATASAREAVAASKDKQSQYRQAHDLYRQGRYAEAAAEAARLLSVRQDDAAAMTLMARSLANQGALDSALQWCDQAIATDRLNPVGHYLRAAVLQEQGRLEEAMLAYKRTLYLDQEFVIAHFALGNLFRRQQKTRESVKHFDSALQLLGNYAQDDALPESDGMTAGRLIAIIRTGLLPQEQTA